MLWAFVKGCKVSVQSPMEESSKLDQNSTVVQISPNQTALANSSMSMNANDSNIGVMDTIITINSGIQNQVLIHGDWLIVKTRIVILDKRKL